jgi:autotransporter-associated beta strand protein
MKSKSVFRLVRKGSRNLAAAIVTLLVSQAAHAATYTWTPTATGTYAWNDTTSKWTTGFPNAIGDVANLNINLAGAQTINLGTGITIGTLNLSDTTTSPFFATTLADGTGGSLAFDAFGSCNAQLNKTTAANSANDIISATVTLNDNLDLANSSTTAGGTLTLSGGITAGTAGTKSIANLGTGTQGIILGGVIGKGSGDVALVQDSFTSALTLNGSAVNTFTGGVNIKRGTLQLDFSSLATPTDLLDAGNALTLGSGILSIKG